jgi:chorismate synthase
MSVNTFGRVFRVTTWGESHGPALGCVVDGAPPGIPLTTADIQPWLDARRPGTSKHVTQRQESDTVEILSGVFEDDRTGGPVTTGAPISLQIKNEDQRSRDYSEIRDSFRPGHADWSYDAKYGVRDYRGGGRASARETAMRVAAGAVARKVLNPPVGPGVTIRASVVELGGDPIDRAAWDWDERTRNPFWSPDAKAAVRWAEQLDAVRKAGSSVGAIVEVVAEGAPAGWGAPLYGKLDADLAGALMAINAVKGVEIGSGFAIARLRGEDAADEMRAGNAPRKPRFLSNHNGGILGGVSSGQPILARIAFKPTSSILIAKRTINKKGEEVETRTKGRHDPCVGIRGAPVAEAVVACVLADHYLLHRAQTGREGPA